MADLIEKLAAYIRQVPMKILIKENTRENKPFTLKVGSIHEIGVDRRAAKLRSRPDALKLISKISAGA